MPAAYDTGWDGNDGVTDSTVAKLNACMNELKERNEDLALWRPKVDALVSALDEIADHDDSTADECPGIARHALAEWGKP